MHRGAEARTCEAVLRYAALCCAVLCCAVLCCAVLCCAVLCFAGSCAWHPSTGHRNCCPGLAPVAVEDAEGVQGLCGVGEQRRLQPLHQSPFGAPARPTRPCHNPVHRWSPQPALGAARARLPLPLPLFSVVHRLDCKAVECRGSRALHGFLFWTAWSLFVSVLPKAANPPAAVLSCDVVQACNCTISKKFCAAVGDLCCWVPHDLGPQSFPHDACQVVCLVSTR